VVQSYIGLLTLFVFWIFVPILIYFKVEPAPIFNSDTVSFLFINVFFGWTYYVAIGLAITFASPLYISVTTMINIPASGVVDFLFHHDHFAPLTIVGMSSVFIGVVLLNIKKVHCIVLHN
jgi:drug/metabolite transporter (DMT)-like permease